MNLEQATEKPTVKVRKHFSFSELYLFSTCPYKHHQNYILGIRSKGNFFSIFGSAIHKAIEQKWKYKNELAWLEMGKTIYLVTQAQADEQGLFPKDSPNGKTPAEWVQAAFRIYRDFFEWVEENFPGCELFDIEYPLEESIEDQDKKFKGYIDMILYDRKEDIYHIIDLKTASYGWNKEQLSNTKKLYQVIFYKHFFSIKEKIPKDKIQCHYILLLRTPGKKTKHAVYKHSVTSGDRKIKNALEWMKETLDKINMGIMLKMPSTCNFCDCGENVNRWNKK